MATVAVPSPRWTPFLAPAADHRRVIPLPPPEVWTLLGTVLTTALIALAPDEPGAVPGFGDCPQASRHARASRLWSRLARASPFSSTEPALE
jgi:hypothetical protein